MNQVLINFVYKPCEELNEVKTLSKTELDININSSIDNPCKELIKEKILFGDEPFKDINSFLIKKSCEELFEIKQQDENIRALHKAKK